MFNNIKLMNSLTKRKNEDLIIEESTTYISLTGLTKTQTQHWYKFAKNIKIGNDVLERIQENETLTFFGFLGANTFRKKNENLVFSQEN